MTAGNRDQLITFARETSLRRAGGGSDKIIAPFGQAWAAVKPVQANESERQGAERTLKVYMFSVLEHEVRGLSLTPSDRIDWNGETFNIREIRTAPTRQRETEIVAETGVTL